MQLAPKRNILNQCIFTPSYCEYALQKDSAAGPATSVLQLSSLTPPADSKLHILFSECRRRRSAGLWNKMTQRLALNLYFLMPALPVSKDMHRAISSASYHFTESQNSSQSNEQRLRIWSFPWSCLRFIQYADPAGRYEPFLTRLEAKTNLWEKVIFMVQYTTQTFVPVTWKILCIPYFWRCNNERKF